MNFKLWTVLTLDLLIVLTPKQVFHGKNFDALIVWNLGYSNYITDIKQETCTHIDPGGTLTFPIQIIDRLCAFKQNLSVQLHKDRYHSTYLKYLRRLNIKDLEVKNIANEIFFFSDHKVLSLGHLNKEQLEFLFLSHEPILNSRFLILPNHGQPKYLSSDLLNSISNYKMVITGSQSRSYLPHQKTDKKFASLKHPLIHKTVWGHLIFQKPKP